MMMRFNQSLVLILLIVMIIPISCSKKVDIEPQLSVSPASVSFPATGGVAAIGINCNSKWSVSNVASWLQLDKTSGSNEIDSIHLTTLLNETGSTRSSFLSVNSDNGQARRITVSQESLMYPSYNTSPKAPDSTGMSSSAVQLAAKFKLGWNIGNTMEAPGGETGWGNPPITESFVQFVKQCGFNAIRIPCAWNLHVDNVATAHISTDWLNRVKQVVQYCINNDMYVLLNIHWDGGWLENNCTTVKKDSVNAKQKAFWEQIATAMRDFDEHLMFASANEPNAGDATQMGVLISYHQTFVNAVRSTGGRNTYRTLVIQGSSDLIDVKAFPTDPTPGRMMYEEHNYTPSQFTFLSSDVSWGKMFYYWGNGHHSTIEPDRNATWGEESDQIAYFQKIKTKFVDKGIPVIMGEYGAYRRTTPKDLATHNDAVDYWITFVTKQALAYGLKPFFWDTGGALDRRNNTVRDQRTIDAIIAGGK